MESSPDQAALHFFIQLTIYGQIYCYCKEDPHTRKLEERNFRPRHYRRFAVGLTEVNAVLVEFSGNIPEGECLLPAEDWPHACFFERSRISHAQFLGTAFFEMAWTTKKGKECGAVELKKCTRVLAKSWREESKLAEAMQHLPPEVLWVFGWDVLGMYFQSGNYLHKFEYSLIFWSISAWCLMLCLFHP